MQKIDEIRKLFQAKKFFKAWKHVVKGQAKIHAIGDNKVQAKFCVKYSDFCKCNKCNYIRDNYETINGKRAKQVVSLQGNLSKI